MSTRAKSQNPDVAPFATLAAEAQKAIAALERSLPLDGVPLATLAKARAANRVPNDALVIAAMLLAQNPALFPTYSGTTIAEAVAYQKAMLPIAQALRTLAKRITDTSLSRRSSAVAHTLGVYQALKGIATVAPAKGFPVQLRALAKLLATKRKTRATSLTVAERKGAIKEVKSSKVAAAKRAKAAKVAETAGGSFRD